jgi:hypothetical protein
MSKKLIHCRTFHFEADFVTSLRCIPMAVRRKLDLCGCKVKLQQWLELSEFDRKEILMWSDYPEELVKLAQRLANCSSKMLIKDQETWQNTDQIPKDLSCSCIEIGIQIPSLEQWKALDELERFALVKLSHPGHEHRNLASALKELVTE